jgi:APA family basic amino acid/polyamine antiporter
VSGTGVGVPTRLARRLGVGDAVVIGLGSMIGAGVFVAIGPAARIAGAGLLLGLVVAGSVAFCNATSSAALAAVHPASGGTYVYGRERLGPFWGYLAGWGFVVGKIASCAAVALTVGAYAAPSWPRPVAVAAVVGLTAVNLRGVHKTAALTRVIVILVLVALALVAAGAIVVGLVAVTDLRHAIGFSSFCVLTYYAIANASAWTLSPAQRRWPRGLAVAGLVGCATLALTLPPASAIAGACVLAVGALVRIVRRRHRAPGP